MLVRLLLLAGLQCPDGSPPPCRVARAASPPMSVAVLTFENRSRDSADAFLADGLADEIATQLGGVRRLTVRSRTVVRRLRGAGTMSVPELGRALSAAFLVNGTVQRAGSAVRVEVELLRSTNGEQAWAQRFDQAGADLFRVQSDVAAAVSQAIAGRLAPQERADLSRRPTPSNEAYQLYVHAVAALNAGSYGDSVLVPLQRAVALDSGFAEAWALLSRARMNRYFNSIDRSPANLTAGRDAAERARRAAPDLPETHLALGYLAYWGSRDYPTALTEFAAALRRRPGDGETALAMALIERRQGNLEAAVAHLRQAVASDPGAYRWDALVGTYQRMRRLEDAERATDSAEAHGVNEGVIALLRCENAFALGDRGRAAGPCHRALAATQGGPGWLETAFYAILVDSGAPAIVDRMPRPTEGVALGSYYMVQVERWYASGDSVRFHAFADSAVRIARGFVEADTSDATARSFLAEALSTGGSHDEALREADHAVAEAPVSRDAMNGSDALLERAMVLVRAGRADDGVAILERLREAPVSVAIASLPLFPGLESLRGNPRFQRLVAQP